MEKTRFTETQIVGASKKQEGSIQSKTFAGSSVSVSRLFITGKASMAALKSAMSVK